ncbi:MULTISPECIES: hypothetical protein [unclassified Lentimonas]|uniref:hypothetical protein n=1 Tax=unclassified Lentimonas TaxID=2630993 RepID=UPI00132C6B86|nr:MULTISPECIES: hypothetical protein [unclassified Lentimonas]CAA6679818.1 Unannotated [Lentimonas sp. CC4]CAA6685670.1 Unannotated [Lentimonas sp. CC6]CAA7077114.1 Unannotated [Lentimonas sp. CC4]CAA7168804.1 Unannotated [Lentimonas sp. CC21]CAA7180830.1 Unannotated [Lentimonas sp. CC8]
MAETNSTPSSCTNESSVEAPDCAPDTFPNQELLSMCDQQLSCEFSLHRPILDRCVDVSTACSNASQCEDIEMSGMRLARSVLKLIRTYFVNVKTGLEFATYVRYALLVAGHSDVDSIIRDVVYGDSSFPMSSPEFSVMNHQLGGLLLSGDASRKFSVSFRPVTLLYQGDLDVSGLFTKRLLEDEACTLAYKQMEAYKVVVEADLVAYRKEMMEMKRAIEARAAELERQREAKKRDFQRRNRY